MSSTDRYRTTDNTNLDNIVRDLERRVSILEKTPKIGKTAVDAGQITVRGGDIVVQTVDGIPVITMSREGVTGNAEIRLSPLGLDSEHVNTVTSEVGSADGVSGQTIGKFEVVRASDGELDGGFLHVYETGAKLGWQAFGGVESYLQFGSVSGSPGFLRFVGRWNNGVAFGSTEALFVWSNSIGAGFGGLTLSYPVTFATAVAPNIGLVNTGGVVTWCITSSSSSACTVSWSGTAAKTVNLWLVRI